MDIVELLKRDPCSGRDHCYQSEQFCQCAIQHKAANEIERLREYLYVWVVEVKQKNEKIERLLKALRYYADKKEEDWKNGQDDGVIARAALRDGE